MLALKYRPQDFNDMIGQNTVSVFLAHMTAKRNLPNLMIFDGVHGSGKTSSARIIGAAVNCPNVPAPCGECESCKDIFDGISMAVIEIDAASHGKVADMEKLRSDLVYSNFSDTTVVILDEAHAISREGFKSMLKTFEEAPPGVVFILVTTEFRKIPETIVSRAMRYTFNRVPVIDIVSRLEHINLMEDLRMDENLVLRIAEKANGSVRDAIMLLDKLSRVGITTMEEFTAATGDRDLGPILLQAMLVDGAVGGLKVLEDELKRTGDAESVCEALTNLFRELLLLQNKMPLARQGEALEARQKLATQVSPVQIMNSLRVLWDLKTKFQHSEAYYEMTLAVSMVGEIYKKADEVVSRLTSTETPAKLQPKTLSLTDMSRI